VLVHPPPSRIPLSVLAWAGGTFEKAHSRNVHCQFVVICRDGGRRERRQERERERERREERKRVGY
jgi:hypothetical protein